MIERTKWNIKKGESEIPQIMDPQPEPELNFLHRVFKRIREAIGEAFPEVNTVLLVYIFDEGEAERTGCDGQCNRFEDDTVAIGICETLVRGDVQKLKYIIMHEIAHLREWEHSDKFFAMLDYIVAAYNERTGESITDECEEERENEQKG